MSFSLRKTRKLKIFLWLQGHHHIPALTTTAPQHREAGGEKKKSPPASARIAGISNWFYPAQSPRLHVGSAMFGINIINSPLWRHFHNWTLHHGLQRVFFLIKRGRKINGTSGTCWGCRNPASKFRHSRRPRLNSCWGFFPSLLSQKNSPLCICGSSVCISSLPLSTG